MKNRQRYVCGIENDVKSWEMLEYINVGMITMMFVAEIDGVSEMPRFGYCCKG